MPTELTGEWRWVVTWYVSGVLSVYLALFGAIWLALGCGALSMFAVVRVVWLADQEESPDAD